MIASYGLGIFGYRFSMSGYRGGHEYFRAQVALEHLHRMTKDYSEEYGGLPDIEGFNALLRERWALGRDHAPIEVGADDIAWHLNFIMEKAIKDNLHLWNSAPHLVLTSASPDGFGFYLDGEDGISNSKGQDRDDINSWDQSSTDFYHARRRNRQILKGHAIGALSAMGVFVVSFAWKKNKRTQQAAQ
ncbi:MAG: hypothetical protein J0M04_12090 [Verrucomicrobia bacterium]|nr:hypothetical protein [Verrucomicrobiota bacterium]